MWNGFTAYEAESPMSKPQNSKFHWLPSFFLTNIIVDFIFTMTKDKQEN